MNVRRFEYIGGGSEKFWEIDRSGASVTVHFGRIGTKGQTQVKDLGSDQAATDHVAKLITEKVKKGYVENGSAPAPLAAPPAPRPQPAAQPPAAQPAPVVVTAEPVAGEPELDEDTWTVPSMWWRQTEPFRGRGPARTAAPDPAARAVVAGLWEHAAGRIRGVLTNPSSDASLVERAQLYLGTAGGAFRRARQDIHPLGAAVVANILAATTDWQDRDGLAAVADTWAVDHGIVFAAEAGALLGSVRVHNPNRPRAHHGGYDGMIVESVPAGIAGGSHHVQPIITRLRVLLAAAGDADYAEATARLADHRRTGTVGVRLASSHLVPTEQRWVDEDIALVPSWSQAGAIFAPLLASVTTGPQVKAVLDATGAWVAARSDALHSIAAHVGPDAAPFLARMFDELDADMKKRIITMLGAFPTDTAFGLMLDRLDQKYVQPAVLDAMSRFPRRAMRMLSQAATGNGPKATTARELLRGHAISNPGLVGRVRPELSAAAAHVLDRVAASSSQLPTAAEHRIPAVLVVPPWTNRQRRSSPVVVEGIVQPSPTVLRWKPGEQAAWAKSEIYYDWTLSNVTNWAPLLTEALRGDWRQLAILGLAPAELVRPVLGVIRPGHTWDAVPALRRLLARFEDEAVGFVLRVVGKKPTSLAAVLLPLEGSEMATRMAAWYAGSKSVRPVALSWFDRHPEAAARDLVPPALGKPGTDRSTAETALRVLDQRGHRDTIRAAAAAYGPETLAAIEAMLAVDPLQLLPARIPPLPAWLDPAHLPPVLLPDRSAALPPSAVGHFCTMLAMSKPGEVYAGIDIVRGAVDPASLAEMAWGIVERWGGAGYPPKDGWVLDALGAVGDDETVRRLSPLIRSWPGEGAHKRAVTGLDVLSAIGTDVALMHLHGIAEKAKFAGLKSAAKAKMEEVADGLGLTADQLADRLVPDFRLDEEGALILDYGDRRFRVGFDEQLKPVVMDEDGSPRKLLPKPGAKDDPTLAPAAYARFAGLKKDVKTVAADQIRRFEQAMVAGRRWTAGEQRALFIDHPLLWHLARRLVWATFDADHRPTGSFRIAEDRTLADASDEEIAPADETVVGIAHPIQLGASLRAWSDVFADYEILQPFPQLGREVLHLTSEERAARVLRRFVGTKVKTGKVLGLTHRGWVRGMPQDAGIIGVTYKPVRDGRAVVIDLDPGIIAGEAMEWPEQTIAGVWLNDGPADWGSDAGKLSFGLLDEITASEALRDLEALVS